MPIYEYSCKKCGQTIEVIQKFNDPVLRKHQGCGGSLTKLISASGFQFKGTGWYVTDYARKGKPSETEGAPGKSDAAGKTDAPAAADSPGKAEKPAAKAKPSGKAGEK
jgi:putative FmdB family regulatory protein